MLNGDLCNVAIKSSKSDIYSQVKTPQDQRDWIIEKFLPIKHKILGCVTGNHEARIWRETGMDISKDIAKALGVPYRAEGMLLKISFGSGNARKKDCPYTYYVYFTHGYGGARTNSAKTVKVERTSSFIHSDVYIMSHDHVSNGATNTYLLPENKTHVDKDGWRIGRIRAIRKLLVKSNSFIKWGGYAETGGFPPSDLETPIVFFKGTGKPSARVII